MTGRIALVTGASRGIGAATAKALAADGFHILVHYGTARDRADAVVAEIREKNGNAEVVGADLTKPDAAQRLADEVKRLSGEKLDVLVLNAGIMPPNADLADCTPDTFDRIFHVNLRSPFFLLQELSSALVEGASVIMVSSVTARSVIGSVAPYASMKAALETLVCRAAAELGPRWIRVNGVAPATTATETIAPFVESDAGRAATISTQALKRIGQPEDIADAISLLCSEKARWITGAIIPVDGGALL